MSGLLPSSTVISNAICGRSSSRRAAKRISAVVQGSTGVSDASSTEASSVHWPSNSMCRSMSSAPLHVEEHTDGVPSSYSYERTAKLTSQAPGRLGRGLFLLRAGP